MPGQWSKAGVALLVVMPSTAYAQQPASDPPDAPDHADAPDADPAEPEPPPPSPFAPVECDARAWLAQHGDPKGEARQKLLEQFAESTPPIPSVAIAMPAAVPRRDERPTTPEPAWYGYDEAPSHLGLRIAPGAAVRIAGDDPARWLFSLDVAANARIGFGRGNPTWAFAPELGYWFLHRRGGDAGNPADTHMASAGIGAALTYHAVVAVFQPRLSVGTTAGALSYGIRPSAYLALGRGLIGIDLSYGAVAIDDVFRHLLMASFTVDLIPIVRAATDNQYELELFD